VRFEKVRASPERLEPIGPGRSAIRRSRPRLRGYGDAVNGQVVGPPAPGVEEMEIGDEISLYNPATDQVLVLNATASDVWRLSDGEHTLEEIVSKLASAYAVDADTVHADVAGAVASFREAGFLQ